jgi:hypothetical protein
MSDALPTSVLKSVIWGDDMGLNEVTDLDEQADPMTGFILRNQVQAAVKSAGGATVVLDLPVPNLDDDVDDDTGGLWKSPRIVHGVSGALKKSSGTKFVELLATIRKHFDGHDDEMAEAVELVTKIRQEVRARAIAAAVS